MARPIPRFAPVTRATEPAALLGRGIAHLPLRRHNRHDTSGRILARPGVARLSVSSVALVWRLAAYLDFRSVQLTRADRTKQDRMEFPVTGGVGEQGGRS